MAKILKFIHAQTESVSPYDRDLLESFPDKDQAPPAFEELVEIDEEIEEPEVPQDPEALREELMATLRADAEEKVKEAYREGLARGTAAGQEAFDLTLAQCAEALEQAGKAIEEKHTEFLDNLSPQVLTLVKAIATKVIEVELKTNPEVLEQTVRRALALLTDGHQVTLSLNPADLDAIRDHEVELLDSFPRWSKYSVP